MKDLSRPATGRLLIVTTIPHTIAGFLTPFAEHFRRLGWRVDAMAQGIDAWAERLPSVEKRWEVALSRNPAAPRNLLAAPARIRRVVEAERYDVIHVHTPVAAFVVRYALRDLPEPRPRIVYTAHGFHFFEGAGALRNRLFLGLEKLAGRWTDYLVVINREDERAALQHGLVPPWRLRYMPGIGVEPSRYAPDAVPAASVRAVRQALGLLPGDKLFLMLAEFSKRKRHADALRALARLGRPDVHLALGGFGPLEESTRRLAERLGLAERVHFLGLRKDVPALLQAADALVLPSSQEGLPRCVLEALCAGTPVIGSDIRGTRDLLDGGRGLLFPAGDVPALAQAMAWVVEHPEEAARMGARAREGAGAYALAPLLAAHEALYAEALGAAPEVA